MTTQDLSTTGLESRLPVSSISICFPQQVLYTKRYLSFLLAAHFAVKTIATMKSIAITINPNTIPSPELFILPES